MLFREMRNVGLAVGFVLLIVGTSLAQAQSACRGLSSGQCSGKSDCAWVEGYTRKDNKKVTGYCRAKGGKGGSTGKSNSTSKDVTKKASSSKPKAEEKASAKKSSGKKTTDKTTTSKQKSTKSSKSDSKKGKGKKSSKESTSKN